MSNTTVEKAVQYAEACGLLSVIVEQLLIEETLSKELTAQSFLNVANEMDNPPLLVIRLMEQVKQKYNL